MSNELKTLYVKEEHFSHLREIVKIITGVEVRKNKSRIQHIVDSKMIFSNILHERGYGCSIIARYLVMNHATVLHYFKRFPWYLQTDAILRNKYERIKSEFNKEYDPVYYLSENELKKEVFSLRFENKELSSELKEVKNRVKELTSIEERFSDIFKMVKERTKDGKEKEVLKKLNAIYNGI
jgi:hypothetical protein